MASMLEIRDGVLAAYPDVYTPEVLAALEALAPLDDERRELMAGAMRAAPRARVGAAADRRSSTRRADRAHRTSIRSPTRATATSTAARSPPTSSASGSRAPGPATRPRASVDAAACATSPTRCCRAPTAGCSTARTPSARSRPWRSTTSATCGWRSPMDPRFLDVADAGRGRDERLGGGLPRAGRSSTTGARQLGFTTRIFRARGLHLDDRHVRWSGRPGFSASIVDLVALRGEQRRDAARRGPLGRPLPAQDPDRRGGRALDGLLDALERAPRRCRSGRSRSTSWSSRSRRASSCWRSAPRWRAHFVGFNTGRWDYINSVADALAWDRGFVNPNIDAIGMTYGYMRVYEDRVRRAVNTPGPQRPLRALAGRDGGQHPGRLRGGRGGRHEAGGRRRRARAARGRERQVGRALEDGPHRAAGLGARGRGPTSSAGRSRRSPTPPTTPPR